jgi:hypothetical protein
MPLYYSQKKDSDKLNSTLGLLVLGGAAVATELNQAAQQTL